MLYELSGPAHGEPFNGAVHAINAVSDDAGRLHEQFTQAGYRVIGINEVRPVLPDDNFDRDEAAAYLRIKSGTLSIQKGNGRIPWSSAGPGLYPRRWLEQHVLDNANAAGKEIASRLTKEAA